MQPSCREPHSKIGQITCYLKRTCHVLATDMATLIRLTGAIIIYKLSFILFDGIVMRVAMR